MNPFSPLSSPQPSGHCVEFAARSNPALLVTRVFFHWLSVLLTLSLLITGCGKTPVEQALQTDANGYLCQSCKARFYTDREIFANTCPACKSPRIAQVVGFVCRADGHVSVGARGQGSLACEKCGQSTSALSIPRATDLQAWGAAKKNRTEVGS